jgi:RNA polymerase subunit RPABC4/transcription elongation factor Spt4
MSVHAVFGINNSGLDTAVKLLILFLVVIYVALVYYTFADARRRIEDPMLIGCATLAAVIFPFVGTIIYMIVRPPEYLDDVRERELEMQAAEARLHELGFFACPHCNGEVKEDFLRCPHCLRKLKDACGTCGKPLDPDWQICPYCESEIPGVTPARRRRRRAPEDRAEQTAISEPGS